LLKRGLGAGGGENPEKKKKIGTENLHRGVMTPGDRSKADHREGARELKTGRIALKKKGRLKGREGACLSGRSLYERREKRRIGHVRKRI